MQRKLSRRQLLHDAVKTLWYLLLISEVRRLPEMRLL